MPEYHPGTEIEIQDAVPTSAFRCAIPNAKRYMKHNSQTLEDVCVAAYKGDYDKLEELLSTGNENTLFNGDLNQHRAGMTALHGAAMMGQTECIELLLKAKADPHVRESTTFGKDPEDGKTALDFAKDFCWDDCVEVLEQSEKDAPYGWYVPFGVGCNTKYSGAFEFGKKPAKGTFSSRPGAAEFCGFDPAKYGTGPLPDGDDDEPEPVLTAPQKISLPLAEPPLPAALLFPGQGSQYVKMMATSKDIPVVKDYLEKAKTILGWDPLELCLNGPESKLQETQYCQPVMFIAGMAGVEKLRSMRPEAADRFMCTAGLSLGEYTALCAAGVFSFEDGLALVKERAKAIQEAASKSKQAMLSVAGLEKPKLEQLCKDAAKKEGPGSVCQIANELFPKGFSCAGTEPAIQALKTMTEKAGALQAKILMVASALHTSLMAPAQEKLAKTLDEMLPKMSPPRQSVYMNASGLPVRPGTSPKEVVELLKKQVVSPVLWEPSVRAMIKAGVTDFYEVGPMKQIKAMMKRIDAKVWSNTLCVEI